MKIKKKSEKLGLRLNRKNTKFMTTSTATGLKIDSEDTEVVHSFHLSPTVKEPSIKKYTLGRVVMKTLEKNTQIWED